METRLQSNVILVAEDDPIARELLVDVLEFEGFSVVEAETGRGALHMLDAGLRPCLVITDLLMPDLDGWQLLAALDRIPGPAPSAVVLSSLGGLDRVRELEGLYGCRVLRKPEGLSEIVPLAHEASARAAGGTPPGRADRALQHP